MATVGVKGLTLQSRSCGKNPTVGSVARWQSLQLYASAVK